MTTCPNQMLPRSVPPSQGGELSAAVELRRLFPGISDNDKARDCARTIAGWQPLPPLPLKRSRACRTAH
jgi:hypothetical protein